MPEKATDEKCGRCYGEGRIPNVVSYDNVRAQKDPYYASRECPRCGGTGRVKIEPPSE